MDTYTSPDYDRAALVTIDVQRDTLDGQPFEIPGTAAVTQIGRAVHFFRWSAAPLLSRISVTTPFL